MVNYVFPYRLSRVLYGNFRNEKVGRPYTGVVSILLDDGSGGQPFFYKLFWTSAWFEMNTKLDETKICLIGAIFWAANGIALYVCSIRKITTTHSELLKIFYLVIEMHFSYLVTNKNSIWGKRMNYRKQLRSLYGRLHLID